jgi:hypothetical protein
VFLEVELVMDAWRIGPRVESQSLAMEPRWGLQWSLLSDQRWPRIDRRDRANVSFAAFIDGSRGGAHARIVLSAFGRFWGAARIVAPGIRSHRDGADAGGARAPTHPIFYLGRSWLRTTSAPRNRAL